MTASPHVSPDCHNGEGAGVPPHVDHESGLCAPATAPAARCVEAAAYPFGSGTFLDLDCQSQAARTLGAASWGQLLSAGLGEPNERAEPFLLAFQEELQHCTKYVLRVWVMFMLSSQRGLCAHIR